jgi:hypothetical protein
MGRRDTEPVARPDAGLCDSCAHQRIVRNTRGSSFSLCERSRTDPGFPRYPRLPVRTCRGYERRSDSDRRDPEGEGEPPQ